MKSGFVWVAASLGWFAFLTNPLLGQGTVKKELDVAFAPIEAVRPVLDKALSPQGRFVMLANKGAVLVIDTPEGVRAAEEALARADLPPAEVAIDFQFVTGLPVRTTSITMAQEVPFPVAFAPPTIFVGPNGFVTGVVPATPTRFQTRNIGVTSESTGTLNSDGSVTLDLKTESTDFEGFVQYGSGVFPSGVVGVVPVPGQAANPLFFAPFINAGGISLPIISTTRITTSVVVRPRLQAGLVHLDLMPRLQVEIEDSAMETQFVDLKQFHTVLSVQNNQIGRIPGFAGADDEFNRRFLGAKDPENGSTAIVVKVAARAPRIEEQNSGTAPTPPSPSLPVPVK
ncbi:MAG: hypothetical protein KDN18_02470 [Verrucomicrobiae bacterium]|nr:hypothetical protein [Verrucomicrobiae bacterium]